MTPLQSFHSLVLPSAIGCPVPTLNQAILSACIDFCERSLIYREKLDSAYTSINVADVELDLPSNTRVVKVMQVSLDGSPIDPAGEDDFLGINPNTNRPPSKPSTFVYMPNGTLSFYPIPDAAYSVQAYVALKPSRSATSIDDRLFEDWAECIASGALYRLLTIPSSDWANAVLAKVHYDAFTAGVNKALVESRREKTRAQERIQPVWI